MKFQQETWHNTQAFTEHNSCHGKYDVPPSSTIFNTNTPTYTEPPNLACTFKEPARNTTSFNKFQTTGIMAITLFVNFLGCHLICTLMITVHNIYVWSIKKIHIKSKFHQSLLWWYNRHSPQWSLNTRKKVTQNTHYLQLQCHRCILLFVNIADLPRNQEIHIYVSMACTGTTQTVPLGVQESYKL